MNSLPDYTRRTVTCNSRLLRYNQSKIGQMIRDYSMIVGVMTTQLYLHGVISLKDKRKIVKSLIERLKNRFNISISEVDHNDIKTSAIIAIAVVSNNARFVNQQLDKVLDFLRNDGRFALGPVERETF